MELKVLEQKMVEKCLDWVGNEITADQLSLVHKEDVDGYHQRIYLAAWNDSNKEDHWGKDSVFVYLFRVFTLGDNINLSVDYEKTVRAEELVTILPEVVKIAVKKSH